MIVYPAIDLIAGAVVRLQDFSQLTTYGTDSIVIAQSYVEAGEHGYI